jgi:hypothetical protein
MINLQPEISTALVRKYRRGMITIDQMVAKMNQAKAALAQAEGSADQSKVPLYKSMMINYQAAISRCLKK